MNTLQEDNQEDFNDTLKSILQGYTGEQLLSIPGIYEILAEEFNNEVLEQMEWERKRLKEVD